MLPDKTAQKRARKAAILKHAASFWPQQKAYEAQLVARDPGRPVPPHGSGP
jgi:hypothetical protein